MHGELRQATARVNCIRPVSGWSCCSGGLAAVWLAVLTVVSSPAWAAQVIDARDGDTAIAKLSIKDQTRIKLERGRITDVIGDVYNKDKNPAGRIVVIADEDDGEVYVRPVDGSARPIKIDLRTERGKFSLLLQPIDMPGDTLVLRPQGMAPTQPAGAPLTRNTAHVRAIKALTLAMAGLELPADVEVRTVNQVVTLWREVRFVLVSVYLARDLAGESYELTNISDTTLVIDERELYRDGVQSVAVKLQQLDPGASTAVWVVRSRQVAD